MADSLDQVVASSEAERLATNFVFTEGPLWDPSRQLAVRRHSPEPDFQAGARR